MKTPYIFSTLRYVYDPLTLEFVNVGIVVYSRESKQLRARCTQHYGRISKLFATFDGVRLRQTLRYIQDEINKVAGEMETKLQFGSTTLQEVLSSILPRDDSSLQFIPGGVGMTDDLKATTESLFNRYVERYALGNESNKRGDDDVWRSFKGSFDRKHITPNLVSKRIIARDYEYEFERAWKNGVWHIYEPISFDLVDTNAISEKANRWVGRAMGLEDSPEKFKLFFLMGAPEDERLRGAYKKAENLLHKMPVPHEFIGESEAEDFARGVAAEMELHEAKK